MKSCATFVQAVLYYLGLSGSKPAPLQLPVLIERQISRQEHVESRQIRILLNEKACLAWVKGPYRDAEHKRGCFIEQWHEGRGPEVEKAEQTVVQLETLARLPHRIPEEVRASIVTLKRRGDFQGALNEVRLIDAALRSQPVGSPADRMYFQRP